MFVQNKRKKQKTQISKLGISDFNVSDISTKQSSNRNYKTKYRKPGFSSTIQDKILNSYLKQTQRQIQLQTKLSQMKKQYQQSMKVNQELLAQQYEVKQDWIELLKQLKCKSTQFNKLINIQEFAKIYQTIIFLNKQNFDKIKDNIIKLQ